MQTKPKCVDLFCGIEIFHSLLLLQNYTNLYTNLIHKSCRQTFMEIPQSNKLHIKLFVPVQRVVCDLGRFMGRGVYDIGCKMNAVEL